MKRITLLVLICLWSLIVFGQVDISNSNEGKELFETAKMYLQKQDYANAIMVYNQAIQVEPKNLVYRRELAHAYYLQGDMERGEHMIAPLLKAQDADEETFQIACSIFSAKKKMEESENAINAGIAKFPNAGILYHEKGELYTNQKKYKSASEAWEKGIEKAPTFYLNYYNLAKVYAFTKKYLWAIIYGEHFVNMESFSSRTEEIKKIIYESYKFLIADLNNMALDGKVGRFDNPKNFEEAAMGVYDNLRNVATGGINVENLTMLRIRFLLEWNKKYTTIYPMELIDYQQRMIQNGYFDCYNQWLCARLDNEKNMKIWMQQNADLMNQFDTFFRNNKLIPKKNQYYHIR